ncbi:MAG: 2'-5' RNA ligase family protein [Firmicutes bacterium]|nr:2'-5' RNA ligase family protein [Bacillota bacterium]
MIFPDFNNMNKINDIRLKYDPLERKVAPHITIVFPFEGEITDEDLISHFQETLKNVSSFELSLKGIYKQVEEFAYYIFLNVSKGSKEIKNIHNLLYSNQLKSFDLGYEYTPHMTVGKFDSKEELDKAFNELKLEDLEFSTQVTTISIEVIGKNEESVIIFEHVLK